MLIRIKEISASARNTQVWFWDREAYLCMWTTQMQLRGTLSMCVCIMDLSLMPAVSPWTFRHLQYVKNAWQEWLFTTWVWASSCLCLWKRERELKNEWKSVRKKKSHQVEGGWGRSLTSEKREITSSVLAGGGPRAFMWELEAVPQPLCVISAACKHNFCCCTCLGFCSNA